MLQTTLCDVTHIVSVCCYITQSIKRLQFVTAALISCYCIKLTLSEQFGSRLWLLQVFAKGAKFSMFKPAEEMVYIGLDEESRTKGKAAIDVVGAQSGKSAGSVLQQVSLTCATCAGLQCRLYVPFLQPHCCNIDMLGWMFVLLTSMLIG